MTLYNYFRVRNADRHPDPMYTITCMSPSISQFPGLFSTVLLLLQVPKMLATLWSPSPSPNSPCVQSAEVHLWGDELLKVEHIHFQHNEHTVDQDLACMHVVLNIPEPLSRPEF